MVQCARSGSATAPRPSHLALRVTPGIAVPLVARGTVAGGLVVSTIGAERARTDDLVQQLAPLGEVFAHALVHELNQPLTGRPPGASTIVRAIARPIPGPSALVGLVRLANRAGVIVPGA